MPELSPNAQAWLQVALVWIGFGSLAGLVARMLLPFREPSSPLSTLTLGITGSAVGLGVLSWAKGGEPSNPISVIGFLAAAGGAAGLLLVFHFLRFTVPREKKPEQKAAVLPAASAEPQIHTLKSDI